MSSEESEVDEETQKVKHYNVRKFSWESREFRRAKKKLDKAHQNSLPGLSKRVMVPRVVGEPSNMRKPTNCPDWACVAAETLEDQAPDFEDLNISLNSSD